MNFREIISIFISLFGVLTGYQLGVQDISFWIILPISFLIGILVFILLNEEIFKKNERR